MPFTTMKCPSCGAVITLENGMRTVRCEYCDSVLQIPSAQPTQRTNTPPVPPPPQRLSDTSTDTINGGSRIPSAQDSAAVKKTGRTCLIVTLVLSFVMSVLIMMNSSLAGLFLLAVLIFWAAFPAVIASKSPNGKRLGAGVKYYLLGIAAIFAGIVAYAIISVILEDTVN